jgi:hypothetical protein
LLNTILAELKLKLDRDGSVRKSYSLRHTYICFRLMEGADIYQIAKNCRTSVEMIEKFFAAHSKTMLDAAAINVRRGTIQRERKAREVGLSEPKPNGSARPHSQAFFEAPKGAKATLDLARKFPIGGFTLHRVVLDAVRVWRNW